MKPERYFTITSLMVMLACACASCLTSGGLTASVSCIRQYADSFKGLSVEAARSKLAGAKIREEDWKEGEFGGSQLVAMFPEYEVRVLFLGDRAITTSFQILSK